MGVELIIGQIYKSKTSKRELVRIITLATMLGDSKEIVVFEYVDTAPSVRRAMYPVDFNDVFDVFHGIGGR